MPPLVAAHAIGASLALLLGAVNLARTPKGDWTHRMVGRVWVVSMYWTILSSFFIRDLNRGQFSWIHGLSVFTFGTLTLGLWAAMTGRIQRHRGFMRGSYFGVVGAFVGAVVVPQRAIPQLAVHHPMLLSATAVALMALTWGIVALINRNRPLPAVAEEAGAAPKEPAGPHRLRVKHSRALARTHTPN